ncbi:hypothetical protein P3S68_027690 [Capsicum galapagoense]
MYNQNSADHKGFGTPMSPRISFSNDFVHSSTSSQHHQMMRIYRDAPVSSDFEFNVTNYSMMSADQLFSKGRLLPFKESCSSSHKTTTLRDELLHEDKDEHFSSRPPKSSTRWKGLLGLKKSHIGSKKIDKNNEGSAEKRSNMGHEEMVHRSKDSQEPYNGAGGGSNSRDVEFRFN